MRSTTTGRIFSIQASDGGVPKLPIREGMVTTQRLSGDRQRNLKHHGGPERALCLYSLDAILQLQAEGHPIYPGSVGENVTIGGLDWSALSPGDCLALGDDVVVQITSYTVPCQNIRESFIDQKFTRISQKLHPGMSRLYARVLQEGTIRVGQPVMIVPAPVTHEIDETLRY
jgi:MOSC domain-containing protein YiiM